ncbi:MAG: hypothetical protein J6T44_11715 [Prevotella sp.]|nr:hypothetical protein [Prevotella sp.]MBO7539940.1 hypothetical protein [Prevotella sp.]
MNTEKDWELYIEEERDTVVAELKGEGYEVAEEGMFVSGFWNVILQRGDERVELSCSAIEQDEVDDGTIAPEDAEWWVQLVVVWDEKDRERTERTYPCE